EEDKAGQQQDEACQQEDEANLRQSIGEQLYVLVQNIVRDAPAKQVPAFLVAQKITGMLLELPEPELARPGRGAPPAEKSWRSASPRPRRTSARARASCDRAGPRHGPRGGGGTEELGLGRGRGLAAAGSPPAPSVDHSAALAQFKLARRVHAEEFAAARRGRSSDLHRAAVWCAVIVFSSSGHGLRRTVWLRIFLTVEGDVLVHEDSSELAGTGESIWPWSFCAMESLCACPLVMVRGRQRCGSDMYGLFLCCHDQSRVLRRGA
ncbi:unnamed protein product, partial [Prorocentrum cordatum]